MVRDAHNCCDSSCIGDIVCLVRDICCNFLWLLVVLYSSAWLRKCAAPVSSAAASSSDVGAAGREQCAADKSGPRHLRRHGSIENWRWIACLTLCLINCADYADVLLGDRHGARRCVYSRWATASGAVTAITSGCAYQAFLEYRKRSYVCLIWFYWLTETSLAVVKWWTFVPVWAASEAIALLQVVTLARFLIAVALAVTDGYEFAWALGKRSLTAGGGHVASSGSSPSTSSADSVFCSGSKDEAEKVYCYRHPFANFISKATFFWLNPLLVRGFWKPLEQQDVGQVSVDLQSVVLGQKLAKVTRLQSLNLWRSYWAFSGRTLMLGGVLKLLGDCVGYIAPLGIQVIVASVSVGNNGTTTVAPADFVTVGQFLNDGYVMAVIVFISALCQGVLSQASSHVLCVEGIRLKTSLQALTYEKSLRLSPWNGNESPSSSPPSQQVRTDMACDPGTLSHLLVEDCGNVMVLICHCHYVWAIPLKLAILQYLLYRQLGTAAVIASVLCLVLMVPAQFVLGKQISRTNQRVMKLTDGRLQRIHEYLANMKLFRLYAWERTCRDRISQVRRRELSALWKYSLQWACATFLTQAATVVLTLLTFVLYEMFTNDFPSAADTFAGLALMNQFTVPLFILPVIVDDLISAWNSTKRLTDFLRQPEVKSQQTDAVTKQRHHPDDHQNVDCQLVKDVRVEDEERRSSSSSSGGTRLSSGRVLLEKIAEDEEQYRSSGDETETGIVDETIIEMTDATFSWSADSEPALSKINLRLTPGTLTVIVGHVGSGKSSLLACILGEMSLHSGGVTWHSGDHHQTRLGFLAQRPWLLHASVRDNILFGSKMNQKRYDKVIRACGLDEELALFPQQDLTLVASGGSNLSGGQRCRIALARAVYSPTSIVLLDDPFASLDVPVAQHVFRNAIQLVLLRQKRTVVVATHHAQYASCADQVVVMEGGRVVAHGSPSSVAGAWPELDKVRKSAESSSAVADSGRSKAKQHWNVLRLVTQTGYVFRKTPGRRKTLPDPNQPEMVEWKRRNNRLNSIHMSHDLPLLTDELLQDVTLDMAPTGAGSFRQRSRTIVPRPGYRRSRHLSSVSSATDASAFGFLRSKFPAARSFLAARMSLQPVSMNPRSSGDDSASLAPAESWQSGSTFTVDRNGSFSINATPAPPFSVGARNNPPTKIQRLLSTVSGFSEDINADSDGDHGLLNDPAAADEERQYGRVPRRLYWLYAKSCGFLLTASYLITSIAWQGARLESDRRLKELTARPDVPPANQRDFLIIYVALSVASICIALLSNILGQAAGSQGRRQLHDRLLCSLSECRVRLFDVEPTGRLLSRFSSDMSLIDKKLAPTFQRFMQFVMLCVSAIVVNAFISPWSLIIAVPIVAVFYILQRFFRTSSRELQRLESLTKAPIVSHLTETLSGLSTLRAFGQQKRFLRTMYALMDANTAVVLVLNSTNRWLGLAVDSLGAFVVLVVSMMALSNHDQDPSRVSPGLVGLAIQYTLLTPIYLQWVVRFWAELEMYFNAVERVLQYSHLTTESSMSSVRDIIVHDTDWPRWGTIDFEDVTITYDAQQLEPAVKNLTLRIAHGQKVGICGRTGSGKSTITNAIFRLADVSSGRILLDNVDIMTIEPHWLRSKLSAVPQDVLMVSGSIRDNLDPEHKLPDPEIWSVLEIVGLKNVFVGVGLDDNNWKGSCNLSTGQQQLLSLARAALRSSPVLILDEPSSALDLEAENVLHDCLLKLFHGRTILLVAHRISSLQLCDRVLLIEDGKLVMDDTPDAVLKQIPVDD